MFPPRKRRQERTERMWMGMGLPRLRQAATQAQKDFGRIWYAGILDDLDHGTEGLVERSTAVVDPNDGSGSNDPETYNRPDDTQRSR